MARMSESAANDVKFLKDVDLPKGSVTGSYDQENLTTKQIIVNNAGGC